MTNREFLGSMNIDNMFLAMLKTANGDLFHASECDGSCLVDYISGYDVTCIGNCEMCVKNTLDMENIREHKDNENMNKETKSEYRLEWVECDDGRLVRVDAISELELYTGTLNYIMLDPGIVAFLNGQGKHAVIIKKYGKEKRYVNSVGTATGKTAAYVDYQTLKEALIKGWKSNCFQVQFEFAKEIDGTL